MSFSHRPSPLFILLQCFNRLFKPNSFPAYFSLPNQNINNISKFKGMSPHYIVYEFLLTLIMGVVFCFLKFISRFSKDMCVFS